MLTAFEYDPTTDPSYLAARERDEDFWEPTGDDLEVSYRNNVAIRITDVAAAPARHSAPIPVSGSEL